MNESFIAIDWGSTNLRAWLYQQGQCIDSLISESGVTRLQGRTPQQCFSDLISPWFSRCGTVPVIMAGMVGSNAGWQSVPYLPCPVALTAIPHHLTQVASPLPGDVRIIPGLSVNRADNANVMRGEETQLIGAQRLHAASLCLMPGTHSKWVRMEGDTVMDFRTVITGELHHLLLKHGLIGVGIGEQKADENAFRQGMETGFNDAGVVSRLFEVRAAHLLGQRDKSSVSEWLSGLLIGNEVAQMRYQYPLKSGETLAIIGGSGLAERYSRALAYAGINGHVIDGDLAFQTGIRSIANALDY
ncbi:2-dehydro-3-deoxygalactonokinase [Enterobacillus tribolii]|uniref:2-keto-3-deoxygalactonate kinase n=1 Tax=Enterobacillus tribolii TaxID=1487935 RepID=A0A370QVJ5_9GAMM|nr:2-dehydro-3-deoxygalactonokinase [Enterobacillus tribolii]MBW7981000.1 2-dehydro-3-deoxygalactonokinase [Enterobacillus tribolii]RDK92943.1 2-keto-3-deoxygalactonate kinase [Enterobacillus tribolii]